MTKDQIRQAVIDCLGDIAPETDAGGIDPNADLREALDIDSMDYRRRRHPIRRRQARRRLTVGRPASDSLEHIGNTRSARKAGPTRHRRQPCRRLSPNGAWKTAKSDTS